MSNKFHFRSLVTSDFLLDFQYNHTQLFLNMLQSVDPNSWVTLYYFKEQNYLLVNENHKIEPIFNYRAFKPQQYFYVFHKNKTDIVNLYHPLQSEYQNKNNEIYLYNLQSKHSSTPILGENPIFIHANEHNIFHIQKCLEDIRDNIFLTFKVQDLINIFSHSSKTLNDFINIYLEKLTNDPIEFLLPTPISQQNALINNFDLNNRTIKHLSDYLTDKNCQDNSFNILDLFFQWHAPLHHSEKDLNFVGISPIYALFDELKNDYFNQNHFYSSLSFLNSDLSITHYQNEIFFNTIAKYPNETLNIVNYQTPLIDQLSSNKFEHLHHFGVALIDFMPVHIIDEKSLVYFYLAVHDTLNSVLKTDNLIYNNFDLRFNHIQNDNNAGSELLRKTFLSIYQHNPQYVFSMLKFMSFLHDNYFLKNIITLLFADISNFSNDKLFHKQLEAIKTEYFPSIFDVFKNEQVIQLDVANRIINVNIRALCSNIEDDRYQHILNSLNFYCKTMFDTVPLLANGVVETIDAEEFIFTGNFHTVTHLLLNFSQCDKINNSNEEQLLSVFDNISQNLMAFAYNQRNKSTYSPLEVSSEMREDILKLLFVIQDINNPKEERIKHKI